MSVWSSHVCRRQRSRHLRLPAFLRESNRMPRPFGRSLFAAYFSTGYRGDADEELRTHFQGSIGRTPTFAKNRLRNGAPSEKEKSVEPEDPTTMKRPTDRRIACSSEWSHSSLGCAL